MPDTMTAIDRWEAFAGILAEALHRMADEEWARAMWLERAAHWAGGASLLAQAAECDARSQVYTDWAQAVTFPGGPVDVWYFRYGCTREAMTDA